MTQMLYLTDSYLKAFKATVLDVTEDGVVLDRSAFYPGGGGQPPDHGTLADEAGHVFPVIGCRKEGERVIYLLEGDARPRKGATVGGCPDWTRRFALMRTHTAMHMLSAVIWQDYGAKVTGGNMDVLEGRLDFEAEQLDKEHLAPIEARLNREVLAAHPVSVQILPREEAEQIPELIRTKINLLPPNIEEIRVVTIGELDLQADGGTHVENSREVGTIRVVKYRSKGKANKRLYIKLEP